MYKWPVSFLMMFLAIPVVFAGIQIFNDVSGDHGHFEAIRYVKDNGIVEGYEDGFYRPEKEINRAEFVKILVETRYGDEITAVLGSACFDDIAGDEWFAKYVCYAKDLGVITGYPDGTFKPERTINVIEALKVILETMLEEQWEVHYGGVYDEAFEKVLANVPETLNNVKGVWYEKYLLPTEYYSLMLDSYTGFGQNVTRGEMAEMVYRIDFLMQEKETVNEPDDWDTVKDYVVANYPISEEYFYEHFAYVHSELNAKVTDKDNYLGGRYHVGIADTVGVKYEFKIDDTDGIEHTINEVMWMHNGRVIEDGYVNTAYYAPDGFEFNLYRKPAVVKEIEAVIPKEEAVEIAKGEEQCIDPLWWTDLESAEENTSLRNLGDNLVWLWYEDYSLSECRVDAESGEITYIYQMLPY